MLEVNSLPILLNLPSYRDLLLFSKSYPWDPHLIHHRHSFMLMPLWSNFVFASEWMAAIGELKTLTSPLTHVCKNEIFCKSRLIILFWLLKKQLQRKLVIHNAAVRPNGLSVAVVRREPGNGCVVSQEHHSCALIRERGSGWYKLARHCYLLCPSLPRWSPLRRI